MVEPPPPVLSRIAQLPLCLVSASRGFDAPESRSDLSQRRIQFVNALRQLRVRRERWIEQFGCAEVRFHVTTLVQVIPELARKPSLDGFDPVRGGVRPDELLKLPAQLLPDPGQVP